MAPTVATQAALTAQAVIRGVQARAYCVVLALPALGYRVTVDGVGRYGGVLSE